MREKSGTWVSPDLFSGGLVGRLLASAVYRVVNLVYRAAPGKRSLRFLLHLSKYFSQATWMVVCRHFRDAPLRNEILVPRTLEFLRAHIAPGDTVLDVGCHQGHLTRYIASICSRAVGIDIDEAIIARAKQLGIPPNAEFHGQDVLTFQCGERFDVVLLHHVLEHIEDVCAILSAVARVSSKALIEVPDIEQSWVQFLLRDLGGDYFSDATHVREYDKNLMREHLDGAGWNIIELRQIAGTLQVVAQLGSVRH